MPPRLDRTPRPLSRSQATSADRDRQFAAALQLHGENREADAKRAYEALIAAYPEDAEALNNLATIEWRAGDLKTALGLVLRATRIDSGNPMYLDNLGQILTDLRFYDKAAEAFQLSLQRKPNVPQTLYKLAAALRYLGRWDPATAAALKAIELAPMSPDGYDILGVILNAQGRVEEAAEVLQHALAINPDSFSAWINLGQSMTLASRAEEAAEAFRRATVLRPGSADAHTNLALVTLKTGGLAEGWRQYEWRWHGRDMQGVRRPTKVPQWDGSAAADCGAKTILLHAEQGFGDTLQFCRYAPLIVERGHRVILEVQPELETLLRYSIGSERLSVMARPLDYPGVASWPAIDAHCPLMSLPLAFGTTLETIPTGTYLKAEPGKVASWNERFAEALGPGLRVGLVWAGNARRDESVTLREVDARRSMSLADFIPLLTVEGAAFVSLQKGETASQIAGAAAPGARCFDAAPFLTDFAETAGAIGNLDLVICVDTSVAHLAGAMGKKVWMTSRLDGCWRWLEDRSDSPWYPTLRLFRQGLDRRWTPVVAALREALADLIASRR
ncbi:MAG: glycosyltransferase family protein [Alphaproteobacteria bacterium]|nr:glycosyltransferase family protein [Alphaproteobacteria bacterium]